MSIADKLTSLINTKQDIKSAISEKGVEVTGGMTTYADAIRRIETGGGGGSISSVDIPVGLKFSHSTISELPQLNLDYGYEDGSYMFYKCDNLGRIEGINSKEGSHLTNMNHMFSCCLSLFAIPQLDTSNVIDMSYMFEDCQLLTTLEQLQLDTSNVKYMVGMYMVCPHINTIPLLNTSNVVDMSNMFRQCDSLTTIPQLDTSNVTSMDRMFEYCPSLTNIPLLNTSNVLGMSNMFYQCTSLTTIPQLDTSNVKNMSGMFYRCFKLKSLPLLDTSNVTNIKYIFGADNSPAINIYPELTDLGGFKNLKVDLYGLSYLPNLTVQSLMNIINNLFNLYDLPSTVISRTKILELGTTNLNKLTDEQKAVATNKGWVLA